MFIRVRTRFTFLLTVVFLASSILPITTNAATPPALSSDKYGAWICPEVQTVPLPDNWKVLDIELESDCADGKKYYIARLDDDFTYTVCEVNDGVFEGYKVL